MQVISRNEDTTLRGSLDPDSGKSFNDALPIELTRLVTSTMNPETEATIHMPHGEVNASVLHPDPRILQFDNFLTKEEAKKLIQLAKGKFKRSYGVGDRLSRQRTSSTASMQLDDDPLISDIHERVSTITGWSTSYTEAEPLGVNRYYPFQEFRKHPDGLSPHNESQARLINQVGQRTHSVLIYLNDGRGPYGKTNFPELGVSVKPKLGRVVLWPNVKADQYRDERTLHEGEAPVFFTKYAAILWIHHRAAHTSSEKYMKEFYFKNNS